MFLHIVVSLLMVFSTGIRQVLGDADFVESGSGEDNAPSTDSTSPPTVLPPVYEVYPNEVYGNLSCEVYRSGGTCDLVLLRPHLPLLTNHSRGSQEQVKEDLDDIFAVLNPPGGGSGSSEICLTSAVQMLCHFTFPYCDPAFKDAIYQPLCQWDCRLMRDFICPEEWIQMRNLEGLIDFGTIDSFNCEILSPANAGDAPMCISPLSGGVVPPFLLSGDDCYTGSGRGYTGTVNVTESGYACQVWTDPFPHLHYVFAHQYPELAGDHNYCRNPGEKGERPWCFTTNRTKRWEYCDIPECHPSVPVCERYTGSFCRTYGSIGLEYVYINKTIGTQSKYEEELEMLKRALDNFPDCQQAMIELVCHVNFPTCDVSSATPRPRKVCRNYCKRVKEQCEDFYDHFKTFKSVSGITLLVIPECEDGDSDVVKGGTNPECFMPFPSFSASPKIGCYNMSVNGTDYNGEASITISGKACQKWDDQYPHLHPFTSLFRKHLEGHNYCRNVDGRGMMPWCYTTDRGHRWEYCNIEPCVRTTPSTSPSDSQSEDSLLDGLPDSAVWGIGGGGVFIVLIVLILFVVMMICILRAKTKSKTVFLSDGEKIEMCDLKKVNDYSMPVATTNKLLLNNDELAEYLNGATLPFITRDQLVYVCDLGEGHFGKVLKAEAVNVVPGQEKAMVAVKMLKEGTSHSAKKEFFKEVRLMNEYNHENIVKLLGVCIKDEPLCMVFEYMEMGDLHSFLRQNAPDHTFSFPQSGPKTLPNGLGVAQMVRMCVDIAAGLDYLAMNHYIHRDLATRNCLVDSNLRVKISDFGMSQDIYVSDYFRLGDSEMLPIRWMPPEAIMYSTFSIESDVWSFGVVLWEIFSFGMQPYYGMGNEQVVQYVKECKVLQQPAKCPQEIYDLMCDCWTINPKDRPAAREIHKGLKIWTPELSAAQVKVQPKVKGQPEYQNMSVILQMAAKSAAASSTHNYMLLEPEDEEECNGVVVDSPNYQNSAAFSNSFAAEDEQKPSQNGHFKPYDKLAPQDQQ